MLRINTYITPDTDVEFFDFTLLPMIKKPSPSYEKGRKIKSKYLGVNDELVVEKTFSDVIDTNGNITSLSMTIDWFNTDGTIGLTKTQIIKTFNVAELSTMLRKRRNRVIDYLQASAKGTPIEMHVNSLLKHYKNEIDLFIYNGTDDFLNAINNESTEPYLSYLGIVVDQQTGKTVKDSILNQIV